MTPRPGPEPAAPIAILHETDDLLVADKPEGLAVIPERAPGGPCLVALLEAERGGRLFVVHRIDKDASGLVLLAKTRTAHRLLCAEFESRRVRKGYVAILRGRLGEAGGRIRAPLRLFGSGRMGVDARHGKRCLTIYRVARRWAEFTQVSAHPVTGRRHQLRVHFYSAGHPIVGDPLYGEPAARSEGGRLMLHARSLAIAAPGVDALRVVSPLPATFAAVLRSLGPSERS